MKLLILKIWFPLRPRKRKRPRTKQNFLKDLLTEAKRDAIDEDKLIEYTDTLLQIFDANKDGKLQLSEMAK